jgi:acetylglutamate kinase
MPMEKAIEKARVLIEALPYIRSFRRKFVVVKMGGSAMDDPDVLGRFVKDVVFMEQVGMWPVLVHGGGPRISAEMKRAGVEPVFIEGHRVTTPEVIEIAARVLIEEVSSNICDLVEGAGGKAIPLNGRGSSFLLGRKRKVEGSPDVDLGLVGDVTHVDHETCYRLADGGLIPVVAPIARMDPDEPHSEEDFGFSGGVPLLNVNGDAAAAAIAAALGAEKIVFLSNVPGVMHDSEDPSSLESSLTRADVEKLIAEGTIAGGMLPKVRSCLDAISSGVRKAHIVSALVPHALLLEMFTDCGIGTEITA